MEVRMERKSKVMLLQEEIQKDVVEDDRDKKEEEKYTLQEFREQFLPKRTKKDTQRENTVFITKNIKRHLENRIK